MEFLSRIRKSGLSTDFILDFDGVIVPSTKRAFDYLLKSIHNCGLDGIGVDDLRHAWGGYLTDLVCKLAKKTNWSKDQCLMVVSEYHRLTDHLLFEFDQQIYDSLKELSKFGKIGILSNREENTFFDNYYNLRLNEVGFSVVQPATEDGPKKPDPEALEIFWANGFNRQSTIFVGDGRSDWETTKCSEPNLFFIALATILVGGGDWVNMGVPKNQIFQSLPEAVKAIVKILN